MAPLQALSVPCSTLHPVSEELDCIWHMHDGMLHDMDTGVGLLTVQKCVRALTMPPPYHTDKCS
jgi:hypothetical protein